MKKNTIHAFLFSILFVLFFISLSLFFYFFASPERIITILGVTNAYLLIFILAFLGGLTTFSSIPYHLVLITLAAGGLNAWLLGFAAATGVMLGDSTSYMIGYHGGRISPRHVQRFFQRIYHLAHVHSRIFPVVCFLYGTLVPLSNDVITMSAGAARYPFWRVMVPLGLGNIVFNVIVAVMARYAYNILHGVLF